MAGMLASLVNKALASAADTSAVALAVGAPCLPLVLAGLGLAVWDVIEEKNQDAQLRNIDSDQRDTLRTLRAVFDNTAEIQRRCLLADVGRHLAADTLAAAEHIAIDDLPPEDERRPYLILHRFLRQEFDTRDAAERATQALIHGLRSDVLKISRRLDAHAEARFTAVCGPHALADAAAEIERIAQLLKKQHGENMDAHAETQRAIRDLGEKITAPKPLAPTPLHTLPPYPAGFVGRTADLAKLRALPPAEGAVLTGLRGMGGIGKTALALVLAHEWAARFPDAQLFLEGHGTQPAPPSAGDLLAQVIRTFHPDPTARLPDDEAALRGLYHSVLGGRKVLILLDNARDAAQAAPLIPPAGCALIVTSRHSFLLGKNAPHSVDRLPADEAAALLREHHPALTDAHAATLVRLCAGLPLALRLAGAHLALDAAERRGPPDTAAYLHALASGRLRTLDADAPDAGEITISETLRLSTARLPDAERAAWQKLGIFTASFDARAAAVIASADETTLTNLVRRSLLEREGANRYELHDLAAEYARVQLGVADLTNLQLGHAKFYTAVGKKAENLYVEGKPGAELALFDCEREQLEAAYAWLDVRNDEDGARQLTDLVTAVAHIGYLCFHPRQLIRWRKSQIRAARLVTDRKSEGTALGNIGLAYWNLGDARKATEYHTQALVIMREICDRRAEGSIVGNLGLAHADLGEVHTAIKFFEQHCEIAREIGDRHGEGNALGNLGLAYADLGDARKAIEFYEKEMLIRKEIGDRRGEGHALGSLGLAHSALGDACTAIEFYQQRLVVACEIGDRRGEGNAKLNTALAQDSLGNRSEAIACATEALEIFEAIEDPNAAKVRATLEEWRGGA